MAWYLNRALTNFRTAVNAKYGARRDLESDGTIGDTTHSTRTSDHNPDPDGSVDAWDMDVDVNGRGQPYAADVEALKRVFQAHPSSSYWIHNDQIARRADGWRRRPYAEFNDDPGRNKHIKHVHWNTRQSHETSTAPWILEDDVSAEDVWNHPIGSPALLGDGKTKAAGDWVKEGMWAHRAADAAVAKVDALAAVVTAIASKVDIDPAELDAIKASARAGALEGVVAAADSIAAAVVVRLPQTGTLTLDAVRDAVAAELAERLAA